MTLEELKTNHPDLVQAIAAEATAGHEEAIAAARAEGAAAEHARIQDVRSQSVPGHEALIEQLAFDGKTTPGEAAIAVTQAQRTALAAQAQAHFADAPAAAQTTAVDPTAGAKDKNAQVQEAKAYSAEHKVDFVTAMKKLGYAS